MTPAPSLWQSPQSFLHTVLNSPDFPGLVGRPGIPTLELIEGAKPKSIMIVQLKQAVIWECTRDWPARCLWIWESSSCWPLEGPFLGEIRLLAGWRGGSLQKDTMKGRGQGQRDTSCEWGPVRYTADLRDGNLLLTTNRKLTLQGLNTGQMHLYFN